MSVNIKINSVGDLLLAIAQGQFDNHRQDIQSALSERKRRLDFQKIQALRPGDRVRFVSGRPRYIIGHTAVVVRVKSTYVDVKLDVPVGKFGNHGTINTPMSMIEKYDGEVPK